MGNKAKYEKLDALVLRAMEGDKKSFEKLCKIEAPQIIYSCTKLMGNTLDGEDAAQEVFIFMQQRLPTLKTPEAFVSWVQKMVYYVCVNMRRKNMNSASTLPIEEFADLFSETDSGFLPEEYINKQEKSKELMEIIDGLPVQIRACILMHYFSEMKISEIAKVLGISEGSVKGYLYVGREKIRKTLKAQDQHINFNSAALLPMAALSQLFRNEMQQIVTPSMVSNCLSAVGIKTFSITSAIALPVVKDIALAAVCTLLFAGTIAGYSLMVSNSPVKTQGNSAPRQASLLQAGEGENIEAHEPDNPSLGSPPSGPRLGGSASSKPTQTSSLLTSAPLLSPSPTSSSPSPTSSLPPPLLAVATNVQGRLAVKNAQSINDIGQLFGKQYYATIEQNGKQLALTMLDSEGGFTFNNLSIAEKGIYTLHIKSIYSHSLVFSDENPNGTMKINLTPGQAFTLAQPLWVVDNEAPIVALSILDGDGKQNPINPVIIEINAYDVTKTTISWEIKPNGGGEVVKQGSTRQVGSSILNELAEGYYSILINVSDAFGNKTTVSGVFYTDKS